MRTEVVRVAQQDSLAQGRHADGESRRCVAGVNVEVIATIKEVTSHDRVAAQLQVEACYPIEVVGMRRQCAFTPAKFHPRTRRIVIHERTERRWIVRGK